MLSSSTRRFFAENPLRSIDFWQMENTPPRRIRFHNKGWFPFSDADQGKETTRKERGGARADGGAQGEKDSSSTGIHHRRASEGGAAAALFEAGVKKVGRPTKSRRKAHYEVDHRSGGKKITRHGVIIHCGYCGEGDHNRKGCRYLKAGLPPPNAPPVEPHAEPVPPNA